MLPAIKTDPFLQKFKKGSVKTFQADTKSEWISSGIDNLRETTRESIQTKFPDYKEFGPNFIRNLLLQGLLQLI